MFFPPMCKLPVFFFSISLSGKKSYWLGGLYFVSVNSHTYKWTTQKGCPAFSSLESISFSVLSRYFLIPLWNHLYALACSRVWGFVSMFVYICKGFSCHWFSGFTALWAREESLCYFNSYFNLVRLVLWELRAQLGIGFFFVKKLLITDSISLLFTRLFFFNFRLLLNYVYFREIHGLQNFFVCNWSTVFI